jgi:3-deoxy-D-manno-octulosonic-acid transferase
LPVSLFFYNIFLSGYVVVLRIAALFHPKARKWVAGRRGWQKHIARALQSTAGKKRVWIHCASLGEFEQGRPLIEAIKRKHPEYAVVLTFFSPSGYEVRKNYPGADHIFYLPADGKGNARIFIDLVAPAQAVFVKYEFWYHYIHTLQLRNIPVILISAAFRPDQVFFRWYGGFFRSLLQKFAHIFVQDESSGV